MSHRLLILLLSLSLATMAGACAAGASGDSEDICDDNLDNDADGEVDCDDSDCNSNAACVLIPERCDDGLDNDEDGRTDCLDSDCNGDPICGGGDAEVCGNGADDDGDGDIDCDDPDCAGDRVCAQPGAEICTDGTDNDDDGDTDCDDSDCDGDPDCGRDEDCGNGQDDDGDGDADCDDSDCDGEPACRDDAEICDDGADNDGDGQADCDDSDCAQDPACAEQTETICDDNVDNDGDNAIDCGDEDCRQDPACTNQTETICDDNIDNDGDRAIDCGDEDCRDHPACAPPEQDCSDGVDNDEDGQIDCNDSDCAGSPACAGAEICDDGRDNDGDGQIDCLDLDCILDLGCIEFNCNDGQDNDRDGSTDCDDLDCLFDPACDGSESDCSDGQDNDDDGRVDCADSDCAADPACLVDACDEPIAIDAEGAYTGTTAGEGSHTAGPDCTNRGTGPEAVYALTVDRDTVVCLDTGGSDYDTVLYVRSTCEDSGSEIQCNDDAFDQGLGTRSLVEFEASAGTEYAVFVDAYTLGGDYTLNVQFAPCSEALACGDGIDNDDDGDIDCADSDCEDSDECTDTEARCDDGLDNDNDDLADCADPDCAADPACAQQSCGDAIELEGPGLFTGDSSNFPRDVRGSCGGNGREALYALTVDATTTVCLDTNGSTFDTVLHVRTDCGDAQTEVACDDDGGEGTRSQVEFTAESGVEYTIFADGFTVGGEYNLRVRFESCDTPIPAEVCDGGLDEDVDGLIDCADPDCADDEICVGNLCAGATAISAEDTYVAQTRDGENNFQGGCGGRGNEAVWRLTTAQDTTVCVDTFESDFDTVLYVREECADTDTELACDDDTDGTRSEIEFQATAGTQYFLFSDAYTTGFGGNVQMRVRFTTCDTPLE